MAAPAPTARTDPTGIKLDNGYRSLITFSSDPNINVWEKEVTPPGLDGGDPVVTTTMHNDVWRTKSPSALIEMTDIEVVVAYDPIIYTEALAILNDEITITTTFPDGSTLAAYGFLRSFTPDALVEGEQPEATCVVVITNQDPTTGAEEAPVLASVAGT